MKRILRSPEDRDEIWDRFVAYIEEWTIRLVLREWDIIMHCELEAVDTKRGAMAGGRTDCWPQYNRAYISLHIPDGGEWEASELEDTAVHELMHVLVSPWRMGWQNTHKKMPPHTADILQIFEEQLCTRLALGFMRTKYPRRKAHSSSAGGQGQTVP